MCEVFACSAAEREKIWKLCMGGLKARWKVRTVVLAGDTRELDCCFASYTVVVFIRLIFYRLRVCVSSSSATSRKFVQIFHFLSPSVYLFAPPPLHYVFNHVVPFSALRKIQSYPPLEVMRTKYVLALLASVRFFIWSWKLRYSWTLSCVPAAESVIFLPCARAGRRLLFAVLFALHMKVMAAAFSRAL